MNMFARFDENPAMTLQDLRKQNVTDGRTHGRTHARTDNVKAVYPPQTKFAECITNQLINTYKGPYMIGNTQWLTQGPDISVL